MNDINLLNIKSEICLFADDTSISNSNKNLETLITDLSTDLDIISQWLSHNHLLLNTDKTNSILFKRSYHCNTDDEDIELFCNGKKVKFVNSITLLGVVIDDRLKFDKHSVNICKKINSKLYILKKFSYLFDLNFKSILYKMFIQSRFEYCSSLFIYFSNNQDMNRIIKCFEKSIHVILKTNVSHLSLTDQVKTLSKFKILPINLRLFLNFNIFLHSIINASNTCDLSRKIFILKNRFYFRDPYQLPEFSTDIYKFSFITISIKFINQF